MSWYIMYSLGYRTADGKIYPLGPYDMKGKRHDVVCHPASYRSEGLRNRFHALDDSAITDELYTAFSYEDFAGGKTMSDVAWLPVSDLGSDNYIRMGYFLIEDIHAYLANDRDAEDLFYDWLTPEEYALRMKNELIFGAPKHREDEEGGDITPHSCADYAFYAYPNYDSDEYDVACIRIALNAFDDFNTIPKGAQFVVLKTEG